VHSHEPFVEVGRTLDVVVGVPEDKAPLTSGTIHYRLPGESDYQADQLRRRGNDLWFSLPTATLEPGETVEYYFDILIDGELHQLGGPADPYRSTFAPRKDVIARTLSADVSYGDADDDIVFHLWAGGVDVDRAEVTYWAPNLPGRLTAPMDRFGGDCRHVIDAVDAKPGYHRYRIHAYVDDTVYDLPLTGEQPFLVRKAE